MAQEAAVAQAGLIPSFATQTTSCVNRKPYFGCRSTVAAHQLCLDVAGGADIKDGHIWYELEGG
jgi:hypothetical protein